MILVREDTVPSPFCSMYSTYETIRGKKIADTSLTADWEKQLAGLESGMITGQDFLNRIRTLAKEMTDDIFNTYSTKEE